MKPSELLEKAARQLVSSEPTELAYEKAKSLVAKGWIAYADIETMRKRGKINRGQAIQLYRLLKKTYDS